MSCTICCEDYNNKANREIECKICDESCCSSCVKRILKEEDGEMRCVHCKNEFNDEDIMEKFGNSFWTKEYKKHREEYLLKREKSYLPETQEYALRLKKKYEYDEKRKVLMSEKSELMLQVHLLNSKIAAIDRKRRDLFDNETKKESTGYEYKCPMENCEGFLNHKRECGICEKKICKDCMEEKEEGHVCDEGKKESIRMIRRDSKGCPNCGQLIFKIDGCDQMYCIRCHTGFSWRTGKIEEGRIHNPEYYRWMRENNRTLEREENRENNQVNNCEDHVISVSRLRKKLLFIRDIPFHQGKLDDSERVTDIIVNNILSAHRLIHHATADINHITQIQERTENLLINLRADFLIKKISEEEWKIKIQRIYKKVKKEERVKNIWNLFRLVLREYIGKFDVDVKEWSDPVKDVLEIHEDLEKIRNYVNNEWSKIGKLYKMIHGGIKTNWDYTYNLDKYLKSNIRPND